MQVQHVAYKAKKILNTHKHADSWFWDKYSAHPYIGCEHGCEYCYSREKKYSRYENPNDFSKIIKIKENAPELLRKKLAKVPKDIIIVGDYQPVEEKTELSRKMLQVCLDYKFPVSLLEKSPLILRDIDLIEQINTQSWASVTFSIITTKDDKTKNLFEPKTPSTSSRFSAIKKFSNKGILAGVAFMPILPFIYDDDDNLEAVVKATAEHGGKFVLAGGLTLASTQKEHYMKLLAEHFPELIPKYQRLYGDNYGPECSYSGELGKKVSRLCKKYGLMDRMPRYVPNGPLAINKQVSEKLQNKLYRMELDCTSQYKIWAYRKAAWTLEELTESVSEIYAQKGRNGLESLKDVGKSLATEIEFVLKEISKNGEHML
ncbi:MAG: radical SAM protein [Candidatus Bathyarchaeota archaeon]|nr:radical SAM protein [Candidatus Bathyarchaeum sp.]